MLQATVSLCYPEIVGLVSSEYLHPGDERWGARCQHSSFTPLNHPPRLHLHPPHPHLQCFICNIPFHLQCLFSNKKQTCFDKERMIFRFLLTFKCWIYSAEFELKFHQFKSCYTYLWC